MTEIIKPLKMCIASFQSRIKTNFDAATSEELVELIVDCDAKLLFETRDSARVDAVRTTIWFANAALTRKGIPPRARGCLGPVPITPTRLLHVIRKQDAPYLDLQWLGYKHPDMIPKRWNAIRQLIETAPGSKEASSTFDCGEEYCIEVGVVDPGEILENAFSSADRLVNRQVSIAEKCMKLKLSPSIQAELRWLCSRKVHQLLGQLDVMEYDLRKIMMSQRIKQLTRAMIDRRILIVRCWKLSGGGSNWQATADTFQSMTGERITRQAIRDMIIRLGSKKLIRRRKGKVKTLGPVLLDI
jgi:hypothetical protein